MVWLALYIAAMFCIALPVAWFSKNPAAAAIFVVWSVGQIAYQAGLPEPQTQTALYGLTFSYLCFQIVLDPERWSWRCIAAGMLFLPLTIVCWRWSSAPTVDPWWTIYGLAWAQVALLLRPKLWFSSARGWLARRRAVWDDHFSMAAL